MTGPDHADATQDSGRVSRGAFVIEKSTRSLLQFDTQEGEALITLRR